jgi:hypothetical protein
MLGDTMLQKVRPARRSTLACVYVCLLGVIFVSALPAPFGSAPYCAVHGPMRQLGSPWELSAILALWIDAVLIVLLPHIASCSFRSGDLQTLTCTRNC